MKSLTVVVAAAGALFLFTPAGVAGQEGERVPVPSKRGPRAHVHTRTHVGRHAPRLAPVRVRGVRTRFAPRRTPAPSTCGCYVLGKPFTNITNVRVERLGVHPRARGESFDERFVPPGLNRPYRLRDAPGQFRGWLKITFDIRELTAYTTGRRRGDINIDRHTTVKLDGMGAWAWWRWGDRKLPLRHESRTLEERHVAWCPSRRGGWTFGGRTMVYFLQLHSAKGAKRPKVIRGEIRDFVNPCKHAVRYPFELALTWNRAGEVSSAELVASR